MINRDISWLYFNERVLQEAKDPRVPLYERIKFLAIYSSNLDEFFRVRVASLRSFRQLRKKTRKALEIKPKKALREIRKIVAAQQQEFGRIFREEILPELATRGIFLINESDFSEAQKEYAKAWFEEKDMAKLASLAFLKTEGESAPFLENRGLYFVVDFENENNPALVNIPSDELGRFVVLPSPPPAPKGEHPPTGIITRKSEIVNEGGGSPSGVRGARGEHHITFLDDILRCHLSQLFKNQEIKGVFSIKLSRDAEMYIEDEYDGDLLEKIKRGLEERNVGLPTRFLFDSEMPEELLDYLKEVFDLSKDDLIPGARYHNFNDFFAFPNPTGDASLHDEPLPPLPHPVLEKADSILEVIGKRDLMLHFPYQKFEYVPRMIFEAANDEKVENIKVTLYRVASDSAIAKAILFALEKGKDVFAFFETKARFDEASNIEWGERLQKAGAKVRYSVPGIKVHTKLLLISRQEGEDLRHYGYFGTGNFNEKTARLYCDHGLFSADQRLGADAAKVFMLLEGKIIHPNCKHLLVSPFSTRLKFVQLIDHEIANAKAGNEAYLILKLNSLEDEEMIEKLYEANRAGVKIQIIVRGICRCVPGMEGQSENIQITSIIDRFLEHARVYIFANGGDDIMYTASADWMTRNLDKRVEVAMPIYDPDVYRQLRQIIDIQLNDNVKARWIDADQSNEYKLPKPGAKEVRAQVEIYQFLKN